MTKTKRISPYAPLVIAGYTVFALLIASLVIGTVIPWGQMLLADTVMPHFNISMFFFSLILGSLLPVLIGYFIGGRSVQSKNTLRHHFNGVLFGLFAFWVMTIMVLYFTLPPHLFAGQLSERMFIANILPGIIVAILASLIAIAHAKSRQAKKDLIEYRPFAASLIAAVAIVPLGSLTYGITSNTLNIGSFEPFIILLIIGGVSLASLIKVKLGKYTRVAWAAVSVSVYYIGLFVISQLLSSALNFVYQPFTEVYTILTWTSYALALVVWGLYWRAQVASFKRRQGSATIGA